MDKNVLISCAAYLPLKLLILAARRLPERWIFSCGRFLGKLAYCVSGNRRRVARANLKAVFGSRYTPPERERIVRTVFQNIGLNFIELLMVPRIDLTYLDRHLKCTTRHNLEQSVARNKGTILLTAHYGNWELSAIIGALWKFNMLVLARRQKPEYLNAVINTYRQMKGCTVIPKGIQMRLIIKSLKNQGIIGILGDQSGRQGKEMPFFGRPVFMAEGAFRLAARIGAEILPVFMKRSGADHELFIGEPIFAPGRQVREEDIEKALTRYRDLLEEFIRQDPAQWMWVTKRWKHSPRRDALILEDGRTGHLRQAEAVVDALRAHRPQTVSHRAAVVFRSRGHEVLLNAAVKIRADRIMPAWQWLRWALNAASYRAVSAAFGNIVICTGAATRAVGLILGRDLQAQVLSCMNPAPFGPGRFALSFVPAHDGPRPHPRVVITDGALNRVSEEFLSEQKKLLAERIALPTGYKIGILLGGDTPAFRLTRAEVQILIAQIQRFRDDTGAMVLLTTSRRTSADVDEFLAKRFAADPGCLLSVFANRTNLDFAVGGILAVCDVVIISGESISMVSEAAAGRAYPLVFLPKKKHPARITKHERFLARLRAKDLIRLSPVGRVYEELRWVQAHPQRVNRLNDGERLRQAMGTLV